MATILCIVLIVMIVLFAAILDIKKSGNTIIGLVLGLVLGLAIDLLLLIIMIEEVNQSSIKPIDVYRGKTMLEITYQDSIAVDSVVKWKE